MGVEARLAGTFQGRSVVALRFDGAEPDDGISKGDYVLLHPQPAAPAGSTVVALVNGRVCVRQLVCGAAGQKELLPVSPGTLPLVLRAEQARILGPLVGVLRRRPGRQRVAPEPRSPAPSPSPDPVLWMIGEALGAAAEGRGSPRLREIARDLRALRDCYASTSVPRLREALLREARTRVDALQRSLGVRPAPQPAKPARRA